MITHATYCTGRPMADNCKATELKRRPQGVQYENNNDARRASSTSHSINHTGRPVADENINDAQRASSTSHSINHTGRPVADIVLAMIFIFVLSFSTFCDWINDGQGFKYLNSATNQYVVNNWLQTGTGYYFLDQNGYIVKGWYLINGKYYYFNKDGLMQTGFLELNGKTYYLNPQNGEMVVGWIQVYNNGVLDYYYFDENGAMVIGWKQIGDKWYYFDQGKALVGTWAKINNIWYHLNETGAMDTGWITCNNKMYHLNVSNGSLTKGWIQDQYGTEYYLSEVDGSLATNCTININGINCTFDELGKCIAKNQFTGSTSSGNFYNTATNNGQANVFGVNVGISPGQNVIQGAVTSSQQQIQNNNLEAGATSGPQ